MELVELTSQLNINESSYTPTYITQGQLEELKTQTWFLDHRHTTFESVEEQIADVRRAIQRAQANNVTEIHYRLEHDNMEQVMECLKKQNLFESYGVDDYYTPAGENGTPDYSLYFNITCPIVSKL